MIGNSSLSDVRIASSRPTVAWVPPGLIEDRLDAYPYDVRFIKPLHKLRTCGHQLKSLQSLAESIRCGPFGSSVLAETYVEDGTTLIRPVNLAFGLMDFSNTVHVSSTAVKNQGYSTFGPGAILFARVGNVNVGVVPEHVGKIAIGPNIIGVAAGKNVDPFFVGAFAASRYGLVQLERQLKVVAQPTITVSTVQKLLVPLSPRPVQTYIGAKVRLAEQCRIRAGELREEGKSLLEQHTDLSAIESDFTELQKQKSHYVHPVDLDDRMDPEFYQLGYLEADKSLKAKPWLRLKDLVASPIKGVQPEYDAAGVIPAITVTNIDPDKIDVASARRVSQVWASSKTRARAEVGEVLITVTGPPLGEVAVVQTYHCPLVINSHIARLKPKHTFPYPHYLTAILNSPIGSIQVYRHCKGIRQKELYPNDLQNFVFPEVDLDVIKAINHAGYQADLLEHTALNLVTEAKTDVEALIEGQLDVDGIIAGRVQPPTWEEVERELA